jgi:hypothetical protein
LIDPAEFSKKEFLKIKKDSENFHVFISETKSINMEISMTTPESKEVFSLSVTYRGEPDLPAEQIKAEAEDSLNRIFMVLERLLRD